MQFCAWSEAKGMDINMKEICIGTILRPHGIKGEIVIRFNREDPERLLDVPYLMIEGETDVFDIESLRSHKKNHILKLAGINHISQVEGWRGMEVLVDHWPEDLLDEDEYYVEDLIGMNVVDDRGREIGRIASVLETAANEIYVIQGPYGEVMIPAVGEFILEISLESRRVLVHLLEGMIHED
jgi:16S rRNA processing protein RimM